MRHPTDDAATLTGPCPESRRPIVIATAVEKLGMVSLIAFGWNDPLLAGLHPVLFADGASVVLYAIYLCSASSEGNH